MIYDLPQFLPPRNGSGGPRPGHRDRRGAGGLAHACLKGFPLCQGGDEISRIGVSRRGRIHGFHADRFLPPYFRCAAGMAEGDASAASQCHQQGQSGVLRVQFFPYFFRFGGCLNTQTEKVLTLHFNLAEDPQALADALADQVRSCGMQLQTGLVGTPYLLHELSRYGHTDITWSLLLRREYPGWLYSVSRGATTVWEHWDGIKPDGTFWSDDMNSYNHYAYGSVADWVFGVAAGIQPAEPGYAGVRISPCPDPRLNSLCAVLDTVHGRIRSFWKYTEGGIRYEIDTPVRTEIILDGKSRIVEKGRYIL